MSKKLEEAMQGIGKPKTDRVFCRRCGQELKDPKSIELGIGPICLQKDLDEGDEIDKADEEYYAANPENDDVDSK